MRGLVEAGHAVTVIHRGQHPIDIAGVEEARGEIGKLREMAGQLRATMPEVVVHMRSMTRTDAEEAVEVFAGHARRVVVASSQDVYAAFGGGHLFAMCHRSLPRGPEVVVQRSPWVLVQRPEPLRGILAE